MIITTPPFFPQPTTKMPGIGVEFFRMPAAGIQRHLKASLGVLKVDYLHTYQAKFTFVWLSSVQLLGLSSSGPGISRPGTTTENPFLVVERERGRKGGNMNA